MAMSFLRPKDFLLLVGSLTVLLFTAVAPLTSAGRLSQAARRRPRIGLALNGEGAIGFAQIGVLKWLTEHHVPVDYLAGTSVGGWVGGGYAIGMFPFEIQQFVEKIDFAITLFLGEAPYQEKGRWAKSDEIKVAGVPGLQLEPFMPSRWPNFLPLLPGIANSYRNLRSFDDLPTPFRCLVADLHTGQLIVMDQGSLPEALRASIASIGVSSPIRQGDSILVSGAVLDSIPSDIVRRMGADIVIASFTSVPNNLESKGGESEYGNTFEQMARALDMARTENERRSLEGTDILIRPDTESVSAVDFTRIRQLEEKGYNAVQQKAASLMRLALSDAEWAEYVRNREERRAR